MNILVTGSEGFVARYLIEKLKKEYEEISITATFLEDNFERIDDVLYKKLDITNENEVNNVLNENISFDHIYHLAGMSSVSESWKDIGKVIDVNLKGTINLLNYTVRSKSKKFLFVSSAEVYGKAYVDPVSEDKKPEPDNPYSITKISAEYFCKMFSLVSDLKIRIMRPVSHIGPYQKDVFSIASFCKQIVMIKKGIRKDNVLYVGNIDVKRSYMDVRDVVDAYIIAMKSDSKVEILNVSNEKLYSLREILSIIKEISGIDFVVKIKDELLRPNDRDMPCIVSTKLKEIGWREKYSLKKTLEDILRYYEEIL